MTPLDVRDGTTLVRFLGSPLVVKASRGLGEVVVLGYDPRRFPDVKGDLALDCQRFLAEDVFRGVPVEEDEFQAFALDDCVGELGRLLRTGGVKAPPMGLLSLFMILYVLAVGPIDYLILKKYKLLKYSALTFLGLAVVFSAAAWFVSFWLFGGKTLVNRVTLVDVVPSADPALGDRLHVVDFAGHYRPRGGTTELAAEGETVHFSDLAASWSHMGGSGGALPREPVRMEMTDPARPTGTISLPFRALRTIRSEIYRERTLLLDVRVDEEGTVHVENGLDYVLRDPVLVGGGGYERLEDLQPGAEAQCTLPGRRISGDSFRHGLGDGGFLPIPARLGELGGGEALTSRHRQSAARAFYALSLQSAWAASADASDIRGFRILRQVGIDRGTLMRTGGMFLLAWTDERDPFGLPGGDEPGFRITVLRKVVQR